MTGAALVFMVLSWIFVLTLTVWSFKRIMGHQAHHDPDGIGPAQPPVPGMTEQR